MQQRCHVLNGALRDYHKLHYNVGGWRRVLTKNKSSKEREREIINEALGFLQQLGGEQGWTRISWVPVLEPSLMTAGYQVWDGFVLGQFTESYFWFNQYYPKLVNTSMAGQRDPISTFYSRTRLQTFRAQNEHSQTHKMWVIFISCEWKKCPPANVCELDSSMYPKHLEKIC